VPSRVREAGWFLTSATNDTEVKQRQLRIKEGRPGLLVWLLRFGGETGLREP
jgi:hypothetical protein